MHKPDDVHEFPEDDFLNISFNIIFPHYAFSGLVKRRFIQQNCFSYLIRYAHVARFTEEFKWDLIMQYTYIFLEELHLTFYI